MGDALQHATALVVSGASRACDSVWPILRQFAHEQEAANLTLTCDERL